MSVTDDTSSMDGGQIEAAVFLGWQKTSTGDEVPLYNVTARSHPLFGSTVSDRTLIEHELPVPTTPPRER